jgi:hypothetical protein
MASELSVELPADPDAIAAARTIASEAVADAAPEGLQEVQLVASELVTHAVRRCQGGGTYFTVRRERRRLRLEVRCPATNRPIRQRVQDLDPIPAIVLDQIAAAWNAELHNHTLYLWAELDLEV